MDEIDRGIVEALEENARISVADIARKLRITTRKVADRIRRLELDGVVEGYRAVINPAKAGYPVRAWVGVKSEREQVTAIISLARSTPEVKELHYASGPFSFLMRIAASDEADLERVLTAFGQYASLDCSRIVSTPVERRTTLI